jgi:hypothetical protein
MLQKTAVNILETKPAFSGRKKEGQKDKQKQEHIKD